MVSEEKWDKMKSQLKELSGLLDTQPDTLPRKRLEQIRGFMNYVTQTYRYMVPYLNGLHMTIHGWRKNRNGEMTIRVTARTRRAPRSNGQRLPRRVGFVAGLEDLLDLFFPLI